ncbi:hypothetical protein [Streptomyces luteocolor]|uniref:hypothetical protein n=1 Tax=Streptomyces luteocolor TaxID=285500 RepID=UPI0008529BC6|nr:hypothetical protein [Streptomyces luteocolor]
MSTLLPESGDLVENLLTAMDQDYCTVYGPHPEDWPKGVRGEYLERLKARRTMNHESHPLHPRRSSAGRRRRHVKQLPHRIQQIAPGARTVLVTPVWTDTHGPMERVYVVTARAHDREQRLPLPVGGSYRIAALLRGAFPTADWDLPQTWRADTNTLTTWKAAS